MKFLILNGPNMNLLGTREPHLYGARTLADVTAMLDRRAAALGVQLRHVQSNGEGALIDALHQARADRFSGVVLNAAGYTHTSVSLRDAIAACGVPTVEVHMTNVFAREPFRHTSLIAPVCVGVLAGFGADAYLMALEALVRQAREGEHVEA